MQTWLFHSIIYLLLSFHLLLFCTPCRFAANRRTVLTYHHITFNLHTASPYTYRFACWKWDESSRMKQWRDKIVCVPSNGTDINRILYKFFHLYFILLPQSYWGYDEKKMNTTQNGRNHWETALITMLLPILLLLLLLLLTFECMFHAEMRLQQYPLIIIFSSCLAIVSFPDRASGWTKTLWFIFAVCKSMKKTALILFLVWQLHPKCACNPYLLII